MELVENIGNWYHENVVLGGDERTKGWFLIDSPIPVAIVLIVYYVFVQKIGPWYMRDRKPMDLRNTMLVYNAMQVAICLGFLYNIKEMPLKEKWTCCERFTEDQHRNNKMALMGWFYYLVKYLDLIDTVFFVLRKKQSHITFLHLFHHISMVTVSWGLIKYIGSGVLAIGPLLNMWVHSFMYTYYFAVLYYGKVSLFWKKLMTKIQIAQFLIGTAIFIVNFLNPNCNFPKLLLVPVIMHGFIFIYLFSMFYYNTYIRPTQKQKRT